jgi:histidinol-phosphatase (PHP family)
MVAAAEAKGLKEICFTDHIDYTPEMDMVFDTGAYWAAYEKLRSDKVLVRRGMEYGLEPGNQKQFKEDLKRFPFDFVIGSIHYAGGFDPYYPGYWNGKTLKEAFELYLKQSLACVRVHENYDVLGHLNYVCKSEHNPSHMPLRYEDYSDICDEIMKTVIAKGKGMEINTSGVDRVGDFLPSKTFLKRFKALGGEIVTVGSDAHDPSRVGQYTAEALEILKDIFGYVCTFENRKPIFHKL